MILAKMGKTALVHLWNDPNDVITFLITVDIAYKKKKAKVINDFITRENLDKLKDVTITKRLVLSLISSMSLGLIHLYDTSAFPLQYEHHFAARGWPKYVHSDLKSQMKKGTYYLTERNHLEDLPHC